MATVRADKRWDDSLSRPPPGLVLRQIDFGRDVSERGPIPSGGLSQWLGARFRPAPAEPLMSHHAARRVSTGGDWLV